MKIAIAGAGAIGAYLGAKLLQADFDVYFIARGPHLEAMRANGLKIIDWLAVFLSLFWLREFFNLAMSIGHEIISPNGTWFGGDEKNISQGFEIWSGTFPIILGLLGLLISIFVIFKIIPNKIRLTFILSGFIGGIIGFILWMNIIGPELIS